MEDFWYEKYWKSKETINFVNWFEDDYGLATDYDPCTCEQNEYWTRRGFALMGWIAANNQKMDV